MFARTKFFLVLAALISSLSYFLVFISRQPEGITNFSTVKTKQEKIPEPAPTSENFSLEIKKIGVVAKVIPNVDGNNEKLVDEVLQRAVAHLLGSAFPGDGTNIYIFGHSSSIHGTGKYDVIFARLGELKKGDLITVSYYGKKYDYTVAEKFVVSPNQTDVARPTPFEQLTLQTSWPVGTVRERLIIKALPVN